MEWKANKEKEGVKYAFVRDTKELRNVSPQNIDYLLGRIKPMISNISHKVENRDFQIQIMVYV